ncbi:hypothetical protein [Pseudomonas sp. DC3000-4b1]|uniref:hypothetical protein n=1 Tax=unclassified Pseudomonas TaxID=196821 RepID=UPI003CF5B8EA
MKAANELWNLTKPLHAFWIDDDTVYAAFDAQGALQLANEEYGYECFSLGQVVRCDGAALEGPAYSPTGRRLGTLWQQLALMQGPGYLCARRP